MTNQNDFYQRKEQKANENSYKDNINTKINTKEYKVNNSNNAIWKVLAFIIIFLCIFYIGFVLLLTNLVGISMSSNESDYNYSDTTSELFEDLELEDY